MKDAVGAELKKGDLVFVQLVTNVLRCRIIDAREGGMIIPINPIQKGMIPDSCELAFQFNYQMTDAPPGQQHPMIHRIPDPETEVIITASKKDIS